MPTAAWFTVLAVIMAVVLALAVVRVPSRLGTRADALVAEPEDQPLAAVVVNPTKVNDGERRQISSLCRGLGWADPLWIETTPDDPGTGQARLALDKGADVVLACGGDGTIRSVAQALAGTGVAMGVLPAGTGNLLARTLGTPLDLVAAARIALTGDDRTIDVGRIRLGGADHEDDDEQVFLVMAGTGFDATIMESTPDELKHKVGHLAYVISGLRVLRGRRARVELTLDGGEPLRRRSRTVVVGNTGMLPGGLVLMPDATVDDGLLDVVNLSPKGFPGWVAVAVRVATRRRRGHDRVEHWQARTVEIVTDQPQAAQIDGDPVGLVERLTMRVDPHALTVRVKGPA